jgi:hypothetical protein
MENEQRHLWVRQGALTDQPLLIVICLLHGETLVVPCGGPYPT